MYLTPYCVNCMWAGTVCVILSGSLGRCLGLSPVWLLIEHYEIDSWELVQLTFEMRNLPQPISYDDF